MFCRSFLTFLLYPALTQVHMHVHTHTQPPHKQKYTMTHTHTNTHSHKHTYRCTDWHGDTETQPKEKAFGAWCALASSQGSTCWQTCFGRYPTWRCKGPAVPDAVCSSKGDRPEEASTRSHSCTQMYIRGKHKECMCRQWTLKLSVSSPMGCPLMLVPNTQLMPHLQIKKSQARGHSLGCGRNRRTITNEAEGLLGWGTC